MARRKRWSPALVAQVAQKAEELNLTFAEAAERFGIPLWRLYRYNHVHHRTQSTSGNSSDSTPPAAGLSLESLSSPPDPTTNSGLVSLPNVDRVPSSQVISPEPHSCQGEAAQIEDPEEPLNELSSGVVTALPAQVRDLILNYKSQNPDSGFKRIEQYLRNTYFLVVPRKRIRQALKEGGLLTPEDSSFDRRSPSEPKGTRRFEASAPGELYQMDITYVYITGFKVLYLIDVIDDHSRFCLRSVLRTDQSADTLIEILHDAMAEHGHPKKLLTDEGSAFYSWSGEHTKFQNYLDDLEIEHLVADPHSPTTTGKVERFHQTIKKELIRNVKFQDYAEAVAKIKAYVHYYNYERPHQGLGGARPADRFLGVANGRTLVQGKLVEPLKGRPLVGEPPLDLSKGYLLFKFGVHEMSVVLKPRQAPEIYLNGVLFVPQNL